MKNKKSNKKVLIASVSIIVVLVVLIGGLASVMIYSSVTADKVYKQANSIKGSEVLSLKGKNIYYYYQPDCHYCDNVKPDVTKFSDEIKKYDVGFNVIDMADSKNSDYWYSSDKYDNAFDDPTYKKTPQEIKSVNDIKIAGTPTMIYADGSTVKSVNMGYGVYDVMNYALKDVGSKMVLTEPTNLS